MSTLRVRLTRGLTRVNFPQHARSEFIFVKKWEKIKITEAFEVSKLNVPKLTWRSSHYIYKYKVIRLI